MRRFFLILLLLGAAGGGAYVYQRNGGHVPGLARLTAALAPAKAKPRKIWPPAPVEVATATAARVPVWLDGLGTVQASATVTVVPMISGPLVAIPFHEGQDVKAGQLLARIDPRPYQAALEQARAKKAQDEATLAGARGDLARYEMLAARNYASAQQAADERATVAALAAQIKADQAAIDTAATNLGYTRLLAPVAGRTGIRQIDLGNIITPASVGGLVTITTLHPIAVVFSLPQQQLPAITAAMAAGPVVVEATPQGDLRGARVLDRGRLTVLDNLVNAQTGTLKLKALFPNPHLRLWPGAFVTVRLKVKTLPHAVVVPPVAVQQGPKGPYVYVVVAKGNKKKKKFKVALRPVTLGPVTARLAVIATGLAPGERVVVNGTGALRAGKKIRIVRPPAPARPGAPATAGVDGPHALAGAGHAS